MNVHPGYLTFSSANACLTMVLIWMRTSAEGDELKGVLSYWPMVYFMGGRAEESSEAGNFQKRSSTVHPW